VFFVEVSNELSVLCCCLCREKSEMEPSVVARKVQKADREKIRRDRLNDHFHQLGNVIGRYHF
jgi:hypothetical protein